MALGRFGMGACGKSVFLVYTERCCFCSARIHSAKKLRNSFQQLFLKMELHSPGRPRLGGTSVAGALGGLFIADRIIRIQEAKPQKKERERDVYKHI